MLARGLTRLCYRVRKLPENEPLTDDHYAEPLWGMLRRAWEGWGTPKQNSEPGKEPEGCGVVPWGNSQQSIRKDALGSLRFDERYVGRGFEDLDFLCRYCAAHRRDDRAEIKTDGPHAIICREHGLADDWQRDELTARSAALFSNVAHSV